MKLSIVATLYQSAPYITEFYQRASAAAQHLVDDEYEIVFVNDGSPDKSLDIAVQLTESDSHVVVVDLSRNFGHHKAMMAGLAHAKGQHVFLIDSDLEEEPEWLIGFAEQMANDKCDVVYGVQEQRKGDLFERWSGFLFWRIFNNLTGLEVPESVVTARLMSRRYVESLLLHCERELFLAGLLQITGFDQRSRNVMKHNTSHTTYTFHKKVAVFINAITAFSNAPLVLIFYSGALIFVFSSAYSCYLVINWLLFSTPLIGWTSVIASIWLLGGLTISFVGIIGIYLAKVFSETKMRPNVIIRHIYRSSTL